MGIQAYWGGQAVKDHPGGGDRTEVCGVGARAAGECAGGYGELGGLCSVPGGVCADVAGGAGEAAGAVPDRICDDSVYGGWNAGVGAFGEPGGRAL